MEIKLNKLILENFKGLKKCVMELGGEDAVVKAENGVGKTTIYDGWDWLLFGKDSDGKADFNVRPLVDGDPLKGVNVAVEAEIELNGSRHTLRKEQHEKVVKDQLRGYETRCLIDEVPKKVSEYQEFITSLCPEELFRQLTDLAYFNGKMHWTARRKVLLDIAGKIPKPAGFETLLKNLNGRSMADYEKVLSDRKKGYDKERNEINPRIDELQKGLASYAQDESDIKLQAKRDNLKEDIVKLEGRRGEILKAEKQRQQTIERINQLNVEKLQRESQLKNDTSGQKTLLNEKALLERRHADSTQELVVIQNSIRQMKASIEAVQNEIEQYQLTLKSIREEYKQADSPNCPTCLQKWPADKPKPGLDDITLRGDKIKKAVDELKGRKAESQHRLNRLVADANAMAEELREAEGEKNTRIAEIIEALMNRPQADPAKDMEWGILTKTIEKLQVQVGEPVTVQLDKIEAEIRVAANVLSQVNEALAQADNIRKSRERIAELEAREKELAQLMANCDRELDQIAQYKVQESKMIEAAVNGRFEHVEFKLFNYLLNGSVEDTCEAIYKGVPYPDMSAGQKILCGIDIMNVLSEHYGVTVPLFIDHSESMTYPIKAETQTIQLYAIKGVKELQIEVQKAEVAA